MGTLQYLFDSSGRHIANLVNRHLHTPISEIEEIVVSLGPMDPKVGLRNTWMFALLG